MAASAREKKHAAKVVQGLRKEYPQARCSLRFTSPVQLLVATILSAQCTDERVNQVTRSLFKKYRSAQDFANARLSTLERAIKSTGFYRNKAKNIKDCCTQLVELYGGDLPRDLNLLTELPGIGRKTANVVLGTAFGIASGVVVDTHVGRIAYRTGLTKRDPKDAVNIEADLCERISRKEWIDFSHRVIQHGRQVCTARKAKCDECMLEAICPRVGVK
ncbi:MAG: endonuclease III [Planctomycetota bacterium]|nr:MAG: endonuclease III [Planctomycetota bacterium]REJ95656.1 MAG: endonuclease III [Planctomycetota bacterium]